MTYRFSETPLNIKTKIERKKRIGKDISHLKLQQNDLVCLYI